MDWLRIGSIAYWTIFVATFLCVALWESARPATVLSIPAERRFARHGILLLLNGILITLLKLSPLTLAIELTKTSFGLFHQIALPLWLTFPLTIALQDLVKYGTHRLFHSFSWLWRIHEVHHSDPDFDVSTAGRAHPIESVATQAAQVLLVLLVGPPPVAVAAGLVLAGFFSLFEHANASMPASWNRRLRYFVITSDVHRIHHSQEVAAQNQNFGEAFPWWDQLLGTYKAHPGNSTQVMALGLRGMRERDLVSLRFLLSEPFLPDERKFEGSK